MLVRRDDTGERFCIHQEHHALLSGVLAGEWRERLHGSLIGAITLHDTPWREPDASPRFGEGDVVDFVDYPKEERLDFYRRGIDGLETIDAYSAFMVSRHYTAFAGTRDLEVFQASERDRRDRLRPLISRSNPQLDEDVAWIRFFDVFSLHLCMTGPDVDPASVPRWLRDPTTWSTSPSGTCYALEWRAPLELSLEPWPFVGDEFRFDLHGKAIDQPGSATELDAAWASTPWETRTLRIARL